MTPLAERFARETAVPAPPEASRFAEHLAARAPGGAAAVLFYGSGLRAGGAAAVLDFYVLTSGFRRTGLRGRVEARLWPEISFEVLALPDGRELRAKVATLPLHVFARAASGRGIDTTVWTRFVQPSRLVHARDAAVRASVLEALAAAAATAARFAAVLGPAEGEPRAYWEALFRATYAAELRVEPPGRERAVLDAAPDRYALLLPQAWAAAGVEFTRGEDGRVSPRLSERELARLRRAWRLRRALGKPLNALRLVKAAVTVAGAARYAAGKLERHTGLAVQATPWRERHPVLGGAEVLWRLRRARVRPR